MITAKSVGALKLNAFADFEKLTPIIDDKTFEKIQEIYSAITAIHPVIDIGDKKQERLYLALHDLNAFMQEQGCKKFELSYKSLFNK